MKRSEMIKIVDKAIATWQDDLDIWVKFDSYGDYIVHLIEKEGM